MAEVLKESGKTGTVRINEAAIGHVVEFALQEAAGTTSAPEGTLGTLRLVAGKADIINRNRRFYSKKVYELAVARAQPLIKDGSFLGEVDHPYEGTLGRAAFRFTRLFMEGDEMHAEGVILNTAGGQHLKGLIDGGVGVKVSTRGFGTITPETRTIDGVEIVIGVVGENFAMEGIDFVLFPSNTHGRVLENQHNKEVGSMTLEQLRSEHPELVAAIESAAREGLLSEADVQTRIDAARTEGVEAGRQEALESAEVVARRDAIAAVLESVKSFLPTAQAAVAEVEQTEEQKRVAALEAQLVALQATVTTLNEERTALQESAQAAAAREAAAEARRVVESHIDTLLKDYVHGELVRPALAACESVEAVDAKFAEQKAFVESIIARGNVAGGAGDAGTGTADQRVGDSLPESTSPEVLAALAEKNAQRKQAGLPPLGGK